MRRTLLVLGCGASLLAGAGFWFRRWLLLGAFMLIVGDEPAVLFDSGPGLEAC